MKNFKAKNTRSTFKYFHMHSPGNVMKYFYFSNSMPKIALATNRGVTPVQRPVITNSEAKGSEKYKQNMINSL